MKMKAVKNFIAVLTLLLCSTAHAQTTIVTGVFKDSLTQEGEPYATVRVFKEGKKDIPVAMSVADIDGNIRQEVKGKGPFEVELSSMGKLTAKRKVTLNGEPEVDLGVIYTRDDKRMLEEVTVVAHKPLVKMETDKMSYNVENDVDSKSSTVLDMLRKVPMVTVDGQDNITVNGSGNFQVYVDGKPNPMLSKNASMVFKSMPASYVKNIEVITNPGAKYDAEGAGGVLNIITQNTGGGGEQQKMDGVNGNVRVAAANKGVAGGVFVNGQKGKFSFSASASMQEMSSKGVDVNIVREQTGDAGTSVMNYFQSGKYSKSFRMGDISLGYELDSMSTLNASASIMYWRDKNTGTPTTSFTGGIYGTGFSYQNRMEGVQSSTDFSGSVDYQRFLNRARTSSITLTYQLSHTPSKSNNFTLFDQTYSLPIDLTSRYSLNTDKSTDHTFMADYVLPLGKGQTLSSGLKLMSRRSTSDGAYYRDNGNEFVYDPALSMKYKYLNAILAAYAEYSANFGKVGLKGGMRYEYTWQDVSYELGNGQNFKKNYGNLVPTASLSYAFAPTTNLGINYNMRISRPGISFLNPYVDRSQTTSITYGNTHLDVEETHNISLVFNHFSSKWMMNATLKQSFCNDGIEQYSFFDEGILHTTYGNIVRRNQTNLNIFMNWSMTKSTRIIFNGGLTYSDLNSSQLAQSNYGWSANSMIGVQQQLPKKFNASLYLINRTKTYTLQGWTGGFNAFNFMVGKSMLKDKLNISLMTFMGIGHGGNLAFDTYSKGADFTNRQTVRVPVKMIGITATYNFGHMGIKQKQSQKKVESDYIEKENNQNMMGGMGIGM